MWSPSKITSGRRWLRAAAVALSLALPALAAAAPGPQSNEPSSPAERTALRQEIERSFEVLPVSGGVVLRPRQALAAVKSIEIKGKDIAINGERVPTPALKSWLDDKTEPVLRLQRLSQADRLALFGLSRAAVPSPAEREIPAVGEEPEAPQAAEAPEAAEAGEATEIPSEPEEPAAPAEPSPSEGTETKSGRYTGERVNIGGGVTIAKGERAEQVVAIGGPARVEGEVEQDVVSVGGSVHVDGKVGGEVVSVGGTVYLGPHAEIDGNVTSVGGSIQREKGAVIHGNTSEVALFPMLREWSRGGRRGEHRTWSRHDDDWSPFGGFGDFVGSLTGFVLLALLSCLVILIARQPLDRVLRQLAAQPWQSAGVGFAAALTFWPLILVVTVLLAITVVGCLLIVLYPFLFFFLALVALVGFTAVAVKIGQAFQDRFNMTQGSLYRSALLGVLVLCLGSILSSLLGWIGGPLGVISFFFGLFGVLAQGIAWIVGFGAVILARFGTSPGYWAKAGAPIVPLVPNSPFVPVEPVAPYSPADSASPYGFPDQPADPVNPAAPVPGSEDLPLSHIDPPASEVADGRPEPPPAR